MLNIRGAMTAMVTPFRDGKVDESRLREQIEFQIRSGIDGLVPVGTTGESPTVDVDEHCQLIKTAVDHSGGRIPVVAGTGANSTAEAIELAAFAAKAGATSHLSVVPYYNKPTQEGLYRHFRTIAEKVALPMILYNVPGRTVADLANETALRLAEVPGIVGIKDATADLGRGSELLHSLLHAGHQNFAVYSGDDITGLPLMLMGGTPYRISYQASGAGTVHLKVGQAASPFNAIHESDHGISSSPQTFTDNFTPTASNNAGLAFYFMNAGTSTVCIDNVTLVAN